MACPISAFAFVLVDPAMRNVFPDAIAISVVENSTLFDIFVVFAAVGTVFPTVFPMVERRYSLLPSPRACKLTRIRYFAVAEVDAITVVFVRNAGTFAVIV